MGFGPPGQSPPQEADSHYWARSEDRYTGLALRQLAAVAVRTLSDGFDGEGGECLYG